MEGKNSHLPTTSNDASHDRDDGDEHSQIVNVPALEFASSSASQESLLSAGPLGSYHRGTAIRMVKDYLSDLTSLNLSLDEDVQKRVEENMPFLQELTEANERDASSPLTWQERNKLSLMLKDYQTALGPALKDQDDEGTPDWVDVEFKAENDGVPLTLYEVTFSGGRHVDSLLSALKVCETHVLHLKMLVPAVKVFRQQCKNLLGALEPTAAKIFECCRKVLDALQGVEVDGDEVSSGSRGSTHYCFESLVGLARELQMVVYLFRTCARENLHDTALELADLPPAPLMPKRWSKFSLAIRDSEWSMDLVEFAFYMLEGLLAGSTSVCQNVSFRWCEEKSRMVLQILSKLGRQDSRLDGSMLDLGKELEHQDVQDLIEQLRHYGEAASGPKWKLSGLLFRTPPNRASVASFLSAKLSGPIPQGSYLPWTFRVDPATLSFIEYLDSGGAGMVGKYTWFGKNVAVKNVRSPALTRPRFEEEAAILATVQHPNVVRLIGCGFIEKNQTGLLVMELMEHDLRTVIESRIQSGLGPFSTTVAIDVILQIAQAMQHLRNHKVLHRDLKAKNILVNICKPLTSGGASDMQRTAVSSVPPHTQERYVAKLADFGLAKCRPHSSWVRTRMAGTTGWRAPEVANVQDTEVDPEYKWPADVYSFGMTCYEILTGNLPFANVRNQAIHENVMAGKRPEGLDALDIPDLLKQLVKSCWASDPENRPTFDDIVKSLWECRVKAIVPSFERQTSVSRSGSNLSVRH